MNLKQWREDAKISQADLAQALGISQSQVSRYEDDPDEISVKLLKRWLARLGVTQERVEVVAEVPPSPVDAGEPYRELQRHLDLLALNARAAQNTLDEDPPAQTLSGLPEPADLQAFVTEHRRKPTVVLLGRSDAGKSRLVNSFLGANVLPMRYGPTTRLPTFLRHLDERPAWLKDGRVIICKPGTTLEALEAEKVRDQLVRNAGGPELLQTHGMYETGAAAEAGGLDWVIVFSEAPILRAAILLDLPGSRGEVTHVDFDAQRAVDAAAQADVLIYASPAPAFLNGEDIEFLTRFIRTLPLHDQGKSELPPLGHLFIVATHAHPGITADQLKGQVLASGQERFWRHIQETALVERGKQIGRSITRADVDARFYAFWAERPELRQHLHQAVATCLGTTLPAVRRRMAANELARLKTRAVRTVQAQVDAVKRMLEDVDAAEHEHERFVTAEKLAQPLRRRQQRHLESLFNKIAESAQVQLQQSWSERTTVEAITAMIRTQYTGPQAKGQAQQHAASYVLELIRADVFRHTTSLTAALSEELDKFLAAYEATDTTTATFQFPLFEIPGDGRGVLAAVVGFGAALTFGLSGGLSLILAGVLWSIFGESWQSRLAKNIATELKKRRMAEQFALEIARYWDDRAQQFHKAAEKLQEERARQIEQRGQLLQTARRDRRTIAHQQGWLDSLRAFFRNLPMLPGETKAIGAQGST